MFSNIILKMQLILAGTENHKEEIQSHPKFYYIISFLGPVCVVCVRERELDHTALYCSINWVVFCRYISCKRIFFHETPISFYFSIANYHISSSLKQHHLLSCIFHQSRIQAWLSLNLCSRSWSYKHVVGQAGFSSGGSTRKESTFEFIEVVGRIHSFEAACLRA